MKKHNSTVTTSSLNEKNGTMSACIDTHKKYSTVSNFIAINQKIVPWLLVLILNKPYSTMTADTVIKQTQQYKIYWYYFNMVARVQIVATRVKVIQYTKKRK
jgi:hypothetical protein